MLRESYIHKGLDKAFDEYSNTVHFMKEIETIYNDIDYKMSQPDLLGKTLLASSKQFPEIYHFVNKMAKKENIAVPNVFIYEDYYYGIESKGLDIPWIEISAKTIQDLNDYEIQFLISREIYKIKDKVTYHKTIMEQMLKILNTAQWMPGSELLVKTSKISLYHWYRLANYSADNYGFLSCGSLEASFQAILKLILNSKALAEQIDLKEYIGQASKINKLDDPVYNFTKCDEAIPYGPFRIKSLLAFATSKQGMNAKREVTGGI
jgi:hypothetical protein